MARTKQELQNLLMGLGALGGPVDSSLERLTARIPSSKKEDMRFREEYRKIFGREPCLKTLQVQCVQRIKCSL